MNSPTMNDSYGAGAGSEVGGAGPSSADIAAQAMGLGGAPSAPPVAAPAAPPPMGAPGLPNVGAPAAGAPGAPVVFPEMAATKARRPGSSPVKFTAPQPLGKPVKTSAIVVPIAVVIGGLGVGAYLMMVVGSAPLAGLAALAGAVSGLFVRVMLRD